MLALQREVMAKGEAAEAVSALLQAGAEVRILHGAWTHHLATVLRQEGRRVWLRVELFGRPVEMDVTADQVERA
jgi:transcription antitermination factor NusG